MRQNAYDHFFAEVSKKMEALTEEQALLPALCAMERQWQLYLDWTRQDSAFCLLVKPETLRRPARELLDLLWERLEAGETMSPQREAYDGFRQLVEDSYDENDGQDVDFGNAALLLEALQDYGFIFFSIREEVLQRCGPLRRRAAYCATNYLYRYHADGLANRVSRDLGRVPCEELDRLTDEYAERDSIWLMETARVREDLEAARDYPETRDWFRRRREEYSVLCLPPIYPSRDGAGNPCITF